MDWIGRWARQGKVKGYVREILTPFMGPWVAIERDNEREATDTVCGWDEDAAGWRYDGAQGREERDAEGRYR